ncbi:MAG TPA: hypothetical protein VLX59_11325 [Acidimicrobiales bacterium]|nr:hypothetical protein [Acidimicrobiales bacterium]
MSGRVAWTVIGLFLAGVCAAGAQAPEQTPEPPAAKPPWLFVGARVAVVGEIAKPSAFNTEIQRIWAGTRSYFPVYSQLGLEATEMIPIDGSGFHVSLGEQVLVAGLDQNFALPMFRLLLGVAMPFGLEVALAPQLEPAYIHGLVAAPSLAYAVGWRFPLGAIQIPVTLVLDPLPPARRVRLSVMGGIQYGFRPSRPVARTPFNY